MGNGLIQVVAGANVKYIDNVAFILLGLKPNGKWEFPGGKVENEEQHYEALEREWLEELGVEIQCDREHFGHGRDVKHEIWFYEVDIVEYEPEIEPIDKEHIEVKYFRLDECGGLEMNRVNKTMLKKLVSKYK